MANVLHCVPAACAWLRHATASRASLVPRVAASIYAALAVGFTYVTYTHPPDA